MSSPSFIPPDVRPRLRNLRLRTRHLAHAHGIGQQRSEHRGAGLEFAQYRAYEPGDDPRQVDWKLYARSDRYFVRESERDSPLNAWIVVDASTSMAQRDTAMTGPTRLDIARGLAACMIELALLGGERFGVASVHASGPRWQPAGRGPRQRDRCLLQLQAMEAVGAAMPADRFRPLWEVIAPRDLVVVLSDFFDETLLDWMEQLSRARREVVAIQLLTGEERDFPFHGGHLFEDAESGTQRITDADAARSAFLREFARMRVDLHRRLAHAGIGHVEHFLDAPLDAPLHAFFGKGHAWG